MGEGKPFDSLRRFLGRKERETEKPQPATRRSHKKYEKTTTLRADPDAKKKHPREDFSQAAARIVREDMKD